MQNALRKTNYGLIMLSKVSLGAKKHVGALEMEYGSN
jgi:hypothetical protein